MSRFTYEIVQAGDRFAVIRRLASGDVAGYDAEAAQHDEQRHFAIRGSWDVAGAVADSRTYATREEAEAAAPA